MSNYHIGNFTKSRIEGFSDGLFAIVATILILELRLEETGEVHHSSLWQAIGGVLPKLVIWIISFLTVCVFWMNHHRIFQNLHGVDAGIFWWNNFALMAISFIPFPTAVLGNYIMSATSTCFYGISLGTATFSMFLLRLYIQRNADLLKSDMPVKLFKRDTFLSFLFGPMLYWFGALSSFLNVWLALLIYFMIPIYFVFPRVKPLPQVSSGQASVG